MTTFDELSSSVQGNWDFWTRDARDKLCCCIQSMKYPTCPHYTHQARTMWVECKQSLRNRKAQKWLNEDLRQ